MDKFASFDPISEGRPWVAIASWAIHTSSAPARYNVPETPDPFDDVIDRLPFPIHSERLE